MSPPEPVAARGAVGRADLLLALAVAPRDELALDIDDTGWFGYVRQAEVPAQTADFERPRPQFREQTAPSAEHRLPLQMPFVWIAAEREQRQPAEAEAIEPEAPARVLDDAAVAPQSRERQAGYEDLVPPARLLPALRRHLGATRSGPLDLERLAAGLAARRVPRRLPRRVFRRWHPDLVVVLDFCPRLWPYRWDMHGLAKRLLRHCGRSGVSLRVINHGPLSPWSDWLAHQNPELGEIPPDRPWIMPAAGTPVLLVSDLGLLHGPEAPQVEAWRRFIDRLKLAQVAPIALAPLGAQQLDGKLARALPVLRWSPDAPTHPATGHGSAQPWPAGLDTLLALVAAARRVDPPLLRALRRLNPEAPLNAGLEGALWSHPDVAPGFTVSIKPDVQNQHLERFEALRPALKAHHHAVRRRHHAHLSPLLMHEETLLWAAHAQDVVAQSRHARDQVEDALAFLRRLVETIAQPDDPDRAAGDWVIATQAMLRRADRGMRDLYGPTLTRLAAELRAQRGDAAVPGWVDPALLARNQPQEPALRAWLVQDPSSGSLRLQDRPPRERQLPVVELDVIDAGGVRIEGSGGNRWLSAKSLPASLAPLGEPTALRIETTSVSVMIAAVRRPRGAGGWSFHRDGIVVVSPPLAGHEMRLSEGALRAVPPSRGSGGWGIVSEPALHPEVSSIDFGIDAAFGVYADLHVTTEHGSAVQRFRWIEPGTFLMGSPEDEPEREQRESPQHTVTLTRGFWLADTACTQALWQAVTGDNPSGFKGADRPVERVSWNEVRAFLDQLEALVPGCGADLATEAEWEYACRAGTMTPFSFGAAITPEQVNYLYAGAEKGLYREETVPVKNLPPNPWGLNEMHGNVWEWCADGTRTYTSEPAVDPFGPDDKEAHRAFRGGSWNDIAWRARSAFRGAARPGLAARYLGFRLCLRSIESGQGPGQPGGPARRESAGIFERLRRRLTGET